MSAGPESTSHAILPPQDVGTYCQYAHNILWGGGNLTPLANPVLDVIVWESS